MVWGFVWRMAHGERICEKGKEGGKTGRWKRREGRKEKGKNPAPTHTSSLERAEPWTQSSLKQRLSVPKSSLAEPSLCHGCVRPIGASVTCMQDHPGAEAQKTLGYPRLPRAPAVSRWAPRANSSPTPGQIPLPFSILPWFTLLLRDLTKRSKDAGRGREPGGEEKGPVGGFTDTTRGNRVVVKTMVPTKPHPPLDPHQLNSTLYSVRWSERRNKPAASWAALTSGYPLGSLPPAVGGAAGARLWPLLSGRPGSGHGSVRLSSFVLGDEPSLLPGPPEPGKRTVARAPLLRSPAGKGEPAAAKARPRHQEKGAHAGGGCGLGARTCKQSGSRPGQYWWLLCTPELLSPGLPPNCLSVLPLLPSLHPPEETARWWHLGCRSALLRPVRGITMWLHWRTGWCVVDSNCWGHHLSILRNKTHHAQPAGPFPESPPRLFSSPTYLADLLQYSAGMIPREFCKITFTFNQELTASPFPPELKDYALPCVPIQSRYRKSWLEPQTRHPTRPHS